MPLLWENPLTNLRQSGNTVLPKLNLKSIIKRVGRRSSGPAVALWEEALLRLDFSLLRFFSSKEKK